MFSGRPDWRSYFSWQAGLLITALSLLYILLIRNADGSVIVLNQAVLASLLTDLVAGLILWRLIATGYSRSKRFALGFLILADLFAKLLLVARINDDPLFSSLPYLLLVIGTGVYLAGTGLIGLVVFIRGDERIPWWK
jgi:hypothetical protein